jgi:alpha-glucosidase (family GH31 glycosyl hydrolase)
MNKPMLKYSIFLMLLFFVLVPNNSFGQNNTKEEPSSKETIVAAKKTNSTTVEISFSNHNKMLIDFYGDNIFRMFQDNTGKGLRAPIAEPPAEILIKTPRKPVSGVSINNDKNHILIKTNAIALNFNKKSTSFELEDLKTGKVVVKSMAPIKFSSNKVQVTLNETKDEYFYGGGVQNGRFSHKGENIAIENQNSWTDGGVASPAPYYWSTKGYGFMWHTFKKGEYDFGSTEQGRVILTHESNYLDVFFMVSQTPVALLNDYYQLTGYPVLLPKFGFYEGHLNAYNRDFWKEGTEGVLFEDGKRYFEKQKDNGGIKESLNGENNNYQFSARAVIDRYANHDMPLGWILPNDGYGAGYGQTSTLDGNIANLKEFGDYAREHGVEIGLWTQSDLHPIDTIEALLQRDIEKEVGVAGVRVLKTDVAWVGAGYSFGLNGVADAAEIMPKYGDNARPFIISLDGWAGTHRYAGIWSGDQTGGKWEYIRFHIPTYIGAGLSGISNITSDMDGIFGGKNVPVNVRDFQWKTFTPMQLNMDGWGQNEKYPHALGEPAASINRLYLKMKSEIMPYAYSIAEEAIDGKPMVRAMFLDYPNNYTYGTATKYQYMYGPSFLVAPIYREVEADEKGNDIRNNIYLPEGIWFDYFSGEKYEGNCITNNFNAPIWKLPVFVKAGAIIPLVNPNNNVKEINQKHRIYELYPMGETLFTEYDDDGTTEAYRLGEGAKTKIASIQKADKVIIEIGETEGNFKGFEKEKSTEFRVNVSEKPNKVSAKIGKHTVRLKEVKTQADFNSGTNVYFFNAQPDLNKFATKGSEFENVVIEKNPQFLVKLESTDITKNNVLVTIEGFKFNIAKNFVKSTGALASVSNIKIDNELLDANSLKIQWDKTANADYYEAEFNGMLYTNITNPYFIFEELETETEYGFKFRAANKQGKSEWVDFKGKTKKNPFEFAIKGLTAKSTAPDQWSMGMDKLFDFDTRSTWHTQWGRQAIPFEFVIDLHQITQVEKMVYLPREDIGNGTIFKGEVSYSIDNKEWLGNAGFVWERTPDEKTIAFENKPKARFIKVKVIEGNNSYGSGKELIVFKVPGSESLYPGDINNDGLVDGNDYTSYMNYTGLRKGDADFDYVRVGDVNKNGWIDAYDIAVVTTQLRNGVDPQPNDNIAGKIELSTEKISLKKGEEVTITVKGLGLNGVNAFGLAIPYNTKDLEFVSVTPLNLKDMENLTNDRLHTNGDKVLYPTFTNRGDRDAISGDVDLFTITFKAKNKIKANFEISKCIIVDKNLETIEF